MASFNSSDFDTSIESAKGTMSKFDQVLLEYLKSPGPHKLEIGVGPKPRKNWLSTDLHPQENADGASVIALDATKDFPIPSASFDFIYAEHMIEHISFEDGQNMLKECHRILKPGGVVRIVTPCLEFLCRIISPDRSALEESYRNWSVKNHIPDAPAVTNAFFLNNFVRAWHHLFIYDQETLDLALRLAGFHAIAARDLNASDHEPLRGLAQEKRLPPGFLRLESMVLEGTKSLSPVEVDTGDRNIALRKPATQSSVCAWSRERTPERDAGRVVSGEFSGSYNCHTAIEDQPWWRVDLEHVFRIDGVRIYNRIGSKEIMRRTSRLEIQTSMDDQSWETVFRKDNEKLFGGTRHTSLVWTPEHVVLARFVRIQLLGNQCLHLEQVEILGEEPPPSAGNSH